MAQTPEHMQRFLEAVALGDDDEITGKPGFELRLACFKHIVAFAVEQNMVESWFWHEPSVAPEDRLGEELRILRYMRALYLATYALCFVESSLL